MSAYRNIFLVLLLAACGGMKPPAVEVPSAPPAASATAQAPPETAAAPPPAPAPPVTSAPSTSSPPATAPPAVAPTAPAKAPTPTTQAPKKEESPPAVVKATAPPLDLDSLKERLRNTNAIGVLTKISLKNQVDDLLDRFRAYYDGKLKTTLADLRRSYDLLVMKVLTLLQDTDRSLATALVASREPIWGILSDPKKFATI